MFVYRMRKYIFGFRLSDSTFVKKKPMRKSLRSCRQCQQKKKKINPVSYSNKIAERTVEMKPTMRNRPQESAIGEKRKKSCE